MRTFIARIADQGKITIPSRLRKLLKLSKGNYVEVEIITIHTKTNQEQNK